MKILTKVKFEKEICTNYFLLIFYCNFLTGSLWWFSWWFSGWFFPNWIGSPRTLIDPNVAALTSSRRIWSATRLGEDMSSEAVPRSGVSRSLPASLDASCMRWVHIRLGIIVIMRRADSKSQVRQCLGFVQLIFGPCWTMNQLNKTWDFPIPISPDYYEFMKNHTSFDNKFRSSQKVGKGNHFDSYKQDLPGCRVATARSCPCASGPKCSLQGPRSPSSEWPRWGPGCQFNRIFRPPNRPPKDGRRPKNERLWVGDELGDDLGHDLGGQKSYWIATLGGNSIGYFRPPKWRPKPSPNWILHRKCA